MEVGSCGAYAAPVSQHQHMFHVLLKLFLQCLGSTGHRAKRHEATYLTLKAKKQALTMHVLSSLTWRMGSLLPRCPPHSCFHSIKHQRGNNRLEVRRTAPRVKHLLQKLQYLSLTPSTHVTEPGSSNIRFYSQCWGVGQEDPRACWPDNEDTQ